MTLKNIIEEIKTIIPVGNTLIIKEIDNAQKLFADETRCLKKSASLAGIDSNFAWTLPNDCLGLYRIDLYDANGYPKYPEEYNYSWDIEHGYLIFKSINSTPLTSLNSALSAVYINYYYQPADITSESDTLEIDKEYYDAIKAKVLERLFAMYPTMEAVDREGKIVKTRDWSAVKYWQGEYERLRVQCKRHINMEDESPKIYSAIYKKGFLVAPKRSEVNTAGEAIITTKFKSKFMVFEAVDDETVTRHTDKDYGYNQENITITVEGTTCTVVNTDGFSNNTFIVPNQSVNYSISGDLQTVTITFPPGWGTCSIQIYEY